MQVLQFSFGVGVLISCLATECCPNRTPFSERVFIMAVTKAFEILLVGIVIVGFGLATTGGIA